MTPGQRARLATLAEELLDLAIEEADPDLWPGAGKQPADLTCQERGNRVWAKKNADATLELATDVQRLAESRGDYYPDPPGRSGPELDRDIEAAERQAEEYLKRGGVRGPQKKPGTH